MFALFLLQISSALSFTLLTSPLLQTHKTTSERVLLLLDAGMCIMCTNKDFSGHD